MLEKILDEPYWQEIREDLGPLLTFSAGPIQESPPSWDARSLSHILYVSIGQIKGRNQIEFSDRYSYSRFMLSCYGPESFLNALIQDLPLAKKTLLALLEEIIHIDLKGNIVDREKCFDDENDIHQIFNHIKGLICAK